MGAPSSAGSAPPEVDWDRLDKRRFAANGIGLFSAVTTLLYPLSVIKTRQMALADEGMATAVRKLARAEGLRGLVRTAPLVVARRVATSFEPR